MYQSHKVRKQAVIDSENQSLSWDVVVRLKNLEFIEKQIKKKGDKLEQLINVQALMEAYRSRALTCKSGHVTYWSNGEQISDGMLEFEWEDVVKYNDLCGGKSFWVEGVSIHLRSQETYKVEVS